MVVVYGYEATEKYFSAKATAVFRSVDQTELELGYPKYVHVACRL